MRVVIFLLITVFIQFSFADLKCTLDGCDCKAEACKELDPNVVSEVTTVMLENLSDNECIQMIRDLKTKYGCDARISDRMGGLGMLMTDCLLHDSASKCPEGKGEKIGAFYVCKSDSATSVGLNNSGKIPSPKKSKTPKDEKGIQ
ncbi:hypothetical protein [Bdellovibrio svalbardensis]|uniref:Uncharacterized protein n=1 Tax=Bdellovibrio svalbardensis TaxID=2972972 RepID=A0ABT6DIY2_9BACT|nr:hypothetical protein [Bdellovibrio svalbardensis]MDG0816809.1 hypothetical protein [Bdellovibrio svalbardensis]